MKNIIPRKSAYRRAGLATALTMLTLMLMLMLMPLASGPASAGEAGAEIAILVASQSDTNGNPMPPTPVMAGVVGLLAAESGLNLVVRSYPWRRAQMLAENGEGLLYGASVTTERLRVFNFSKPLYFANQRLITAARNPLNFQRWEDLRGKVISIGSGEHFGPEFEEYRGKLFNVEENSATIPSRLKMLNMGRVDAVVLDSFRSTQQLEARLNCSFGDIGKWSVVDKPLETEPVLIAVPKASQLNAILPALNDAIDRLTKSRDILKLLEKKSANTDC